MQHYLLIYGAYKDTRRAKIRAHYYYYYCCLYY